MYRYTLLILIIISPAFAQGINNEELARSVFEKAARFEADSQWTDALRHYEDAVAYAPKVAEYRYRAAFVAKQLKQPDKATTLLEPTLSHDYTPALNLYAELLLDSGETEAAKSWYEKVRSLDPYDTDSYFGLGECARRDYDAGNRKAKVRAMAHYQAYLSQAVTGGKRQEAEKWLRFLRYGDERGGQLHTAIQAIIVGQYDRAKRLLQGDRRDGIQPLIPTLKEAYHWLGVIEKRRKNLSAARQNWLKAKSNPLSQLELARLHINRGEYSEALDYLKAARQRAPDLLEARFELGWVYLQLGRELEAKGELWSIVRETPQRPEADRALLLLEQLGEKIPRKVSYSLVSPPTEAKLLKDYGGEHYDPVQHQRLKRIVRRLRAETLQLSERTFQVRILQSVNVPNAWAVSPNRIFITRGLIQFVDSTPALEKACDDVLGFIIGHEMVHLVEGDMERASALQGAIGGGMTDVQTRQKILHNLEYTADRKGVLYAYQAGYDPFAAVLWCRASENRFGNRREDADHPTYSQRESALRQFLLRDLGDAHDAFHDGVKSLQDGNPSKAATAFQRYLMRIPADIEAQYNLALASFYEGIALLRVSPWEPWHLAKGIALEPTFPRPTEPGSKNIHRAKQLLESATHEVERILRFQPTHAKSHRLRGDIELARQQLSQTPDYSAVHPYYRSALNHRPADPATMNNLGVVACLEKRWKDAKQEFQRCVRQGGAVAAIARRNLEMLPR
jgi:tetratricopeptide (TPR) repeat protein